VGSNAAGTGRNIRGAESFHNAIQGIERSRTRIDKAAIRGFLMAHEARFQRIIGVEFSPKLAKIASEQRPFALSLEMPRIMNPE